MTFTEFIKFSNYSATWAATCVLYKPDTRPAKLAERLGFNPGKEERSKMCLVISGKKMEDVFPSVPVKKDIKQPS